jgi:phage baseplate assembly protein V
VDNVRNVRGLNRLLAPLWTRIQLIIGRFVVQAIREDPLLRTAQLAGLADEILEGVELFQEYGFASRPKAGSEAIAAAIAGLRDHAVIIATADRRYKVTLEDGEVAIHDDLGQSVHLKRTGVVVETPLDVDVDAEGDVTVDSEGDVTIDGATGVDIKAAAGGITVVATVGDIDLEATAGVVNVKGLTNVNLGALAALQKLCNETFLATFNAHRHSGDLTGVFVSDVAVLDVDTTIITKAD